MMIFCWKTADNFAIRGIDENHTNPKARFKQLGEPKYPPVAQLAQLETASEVVWGELAAEAMIVGSAFTLTVPATGLAVVDVPLP